jgi:hypothetical protein
MNTTSMVKQFINTLNRLDISPWGGLVVIAIHGGDLPITDEYFNNFNIDVYKD